MVRFIIRLKDARGIAYTSFTFQYGQIYYDSYQVMQNTLPKFYIPIWLDLLYTQKDI